MSHAALLVFALRVGISGTANLSLDDAVDTALRNNLDVQIERSGVAAAEQAEQGARGLHDPTFRWTPQFQVNNTPSPSLLSGSNGKLSDRDWNQTASLHQRAWQGSLLDLNLNTSRVSTNNPFIGLNPYFTTQFKLGYAQPLLRGRAIDSDRAILRIRGVQTAIARTRVELRAIDIVSRVEQAYWDLVAARESAEVNREAVELARTILEQNRRMIAAGSLAAVELSASQAELQRRLDNLYASLESITLAENNIKVLLAPRREDPLWSQELLPASSENAAPTNAGNLTAAVGEALQARPELRELAQELQVNRIETLQNTDQTKPAIDLAVSYTNASLSGTPRHTVDPLTASFEPYAIRANQPSVLAGLGPVIAPSAGTLAGGHYQSVQAGVNFEWTARNRQARANLERSAIDARRLKLQRVQAEQAIEAQVRNAIQSLDSAKQRITAAVAGSHAAREKLDSEQRLFGHGESTNFLVLTRQNEYSDARQRLTAAKSAFNKSVARFQEAVGQTLTTRNLELAK